MNEAPHPNARQMSRARALHALHAFPTGKRALAPNAPTPTKNRLEPAWVPADKGELVNAALPDNPGSAVE